MITDEMKKAVIAAVDGECEGPAITEAQAEAILSYVERAAWLPIETAPTDPSVAFLVTGYRWEDPAKGRFYDRACFFGGAFHGIDPETDEPHEVTFRNLTHWRPEPTLEDFGEEA